MQSIEFKELKATLVTVLQEFQETYKVAGVDIAISNLSINQKKIEDIDWDNPSAVHKSNQIKRDIALLEKKIYKWDTLKRELYDIQEYLIIAEMEKETSLIKTINDRIKNSHKILSKLNIEILLNGEDDNKNAYLNIHPGAGGTESQDWAEMLYRAYTKWSERKNWSVKLVDYQVGEEAGIKNATLYIQGENAFGFLKAENGIHRLVRISPFDSNKRRHTSFAALHVIPEITDTTQTIINPKDLRIDTYRSSGAGGQHVNKTDSAVRITHIPTNIIVACQNERSQTKNKNTAMKILQSRLYKLEKEKEKDTIASKSGERKNISWGNQIRSYVFHPYNMVKDLRTNHETGNVQEVLDGNFDPFVTAYLQHEQIKQQQ